MRNPGYAAFGSLATLLIGGRLVRLDNLQLKKEADLRYQLIHVREYAEPIALLHGEKQERQHIDQRLRKVVDNYRFIIAVTRNLGFFTSGYNYLVPIIPVLIVAPRYLHGEIEFGVVTQAAMAFAQILGAFSLIVVQFQSISTFAAVVARLGSLKEAIDTATQTRSGIQIVEDGRRLAYEGLTLRTPKEGHLLVGQLSLEIPRGQRVLITGSNGSGKSALFRATAGIWDEGEGRIVRAPRGQVMFLPQRPYTVLGSLRDQLVYGLEVDGLSDERLRAALAAVHLEPILERAGGLDVERDWVNLLSTGEQQLLAIARLLVANPAYAFLDQAISALHPKRGQEVYRMLAQTSITYLSVADHIDIEEYHNLFLEIRDEGRWKVEGAGGSNRSS